MPFLHGQERLVACAGGWTTAFPLNLGNWESLEQTTPASINWWMHAALFPNNEKVSKGIAS